MTQHNEAAQPERRPQTISLNWLGGTRPEISRAFAVLSLLSLAIFLSVSGHLQSRFLTQKI